MTDSKDSPKLSGKIGIDTCILAYALADKSKIKKADEADRVKRGKLLFRELIDNSNVEICLSTITLAEYLVCIDPRKHHAVQQQIEQTCTIYPFNARASHTAAALAAKEKPIRFELLGDGTTKAAIIADIYIVATLLSSGCKRIYSNDRGFLRLVDLGGGKSLELPTQFGLFDDEPD